VGFVLVFKPIFGGKDHKVKGNVDAELVLQVMIDYGEYEQALIVTGDGDFYCLVKHLDLNGKLLRVLAPSAENCPSLLKKVSGQRIAFVNDLRQKLEYIKKRTP
jgi:uncharacterized LabA/DUF88 family protein